jgi:DNA primase catalytic core
MKIQDLKSRLDIIEVAQDLGIEINPRSKKATCPFHDDKTPSLHFSREKQIATCFSGNCTAGTMDVINLVEKKLNLNTAEALKYLKQQNHLEVKPMPKTPSSNNRTATLTTIFEETKTNLKKSQKAKDYLNNRNLNPNLEVGYFTERQHQKWTTNFKEEAVKAGILNQYANKSYGSNFKNTLVFPMKNCQGDIVSLYGRSITGKDHRYLKGQHQGLFPSYPDPKTKTLILTESIIDASSLNQYSKPQTSILALYGTNGLTAEHSEALSQLKDLEEIIFLLDGDEAGNQGSKTNGERLHEKFPGIKITQGNLPENEDINSLLIGHEIGIIDNILEKREALHEAEKPKEAKSQEPKAKSQEPKANSLNTLNTSNPDKLTYTQTPLKITIWGGVDYSDLSKLKLSLNLHNQETKQNFRDEVNLYSNKSKKFFISDAAEELGLAETELKQILNQFTEAVESYRLSQKENYKNKDEKQVYQLTETEKTQANKELRNPDLVKSLKKAMQEIGLVGELNNGLLLFLIFLTRDFTHPLHALVHGSSGSGKTNLLKSILKLVPKESKYETTALTENVLFRPPYKDFWKNKILLLEDLDGSYKALLPLREFMSNQSISKLASEPNLKTGKYEQVKLEAEGPIVIAGATTKDKVYEDNSNRSYLIHVDESKTHQKEIMNHQNKQAAGLIDLDNVEEITQRIQNMQRMLNPNIKVINPFQPQLELPEYIFKKLRTNTHYITLIQAITYLHQYQRTIKTSQKGQLYIETTLEDIALANELSKQSLLHKSDELGGEVRSFFEHLKAKVQPEKTFTAKDIREQLRMNPMKFSRRLTELKNRGYLKQIGGSYKTSYEYEITTWDDYKVLQNGLKIMDEILEKLWTKYPDGHYQKAS